MTNNKVRQNRMSYLLIGILLTGMGIYLNYNELVNGVFPDAFILLPAGLSNLMFAYLTPHLFPRDERAREIMGKAMTINYFVLFGSMLILFLLTSSLTPIMLDGTQVIITLFTIMVLTIPGTMIIYAKRI